MKITIAILGERFKSLRKHLSLSQGELSNHTGIDINAISRLEQGKSSTIDTLLTLCNYYSDFFYMDNILANNFKVIDLNSISEGDQTKGIAIEQLKFLNENTREHIQTIVNLLSK